MPIEVTVPNRLRQQHREAIEAALDRVQIAAAADDRAQILGSSKDLLETIAKVGLRELGIAYGANADFGGLIHALLIELERHPKLYQGRQALQRLADSYKRIASAIEELRNHEGTGHGQPTLTDLERDHAGFVQDSASLWAKWILRAIDARLADRDALDELINDLDRFQTFTGGGLVARLNALPLDEEAYEEMRRLGRALGRRRARETMVVETDVIAPLLEGQLVAPQPLVRGIIEGLFIDANGYVRSDASSLKALTGLAALANDDDPAAVLRDLIAQVEDSEASYPFGLVEQAGVITALAAQRDAAEDDEMRDVLDELSFAVLGLHSRWKLNLRVLWTGEGGNTTYNAVWYPNMGWFVIGDNGQLRHPDDIEIPLEAAVTVIHQPNHRLQIETVSPIRIADSELVGPDETRYDPDESGGGLPSDEWFVVFRDISF